MENFDNTIIEGYRRRWRRRRRQRRAAYKERQRQRETRNPGQPTPATHAGNKYAVRATPHSDSHLMRLC